VPKRADYRLVHRSRVQEEIWEIESAFARSRIIEPDSKEWFEWLEAIPSSFSYEYDGQYSFSPRHRPTTRFYRYTARKEKRRGGTYWYAYVRRKGIMKKTYLGKTENLTAWHLDIFAWRLDLRQQ
jgi:hypothetical protein